MNIYLVGFMGSGKSTWAKQLSRELLMPAFDMDDIIEDIEGENIFDIFYGKGETYFRSAERVVLEDLVRINKGYIIATGGGTACFNDNMDLMNKNGITLYLKASKQFLYSRLKNSRLARPKIALLDNLELKNFIETTLDEREEFYNKATTIIDIEKITLPIFMQTISRCIIDQH
jgi:shikimate kinase